MTRADLAGAFGGADLDALIAALEAHFLERLDGAWRVRGATRYLRLKESRKRGAEMTNSKRSKSALSERPAATLLSDALLPNTEHRTPSTETKALALTPSEPSPPRSRSDPRLKPLEARLIQSYEHMRREKYPHGGAKDTQALKRLLGWCADDDEIERRWRKGIAFGNAWPGTNTISELGMQAKWSALGAPDAKIKGSAATSYEPWGPDDDFLAGISGGTQ